MSTSNQSFDKSGLSRDRVALAMAALASSASVAGAFTGGLSTDVIDTLRILAERSGVDLTSKKATDKVRLSEVAMDALFSLSIGEMRPRDARGILGSNGLLDPKQYKVATPANVRDELKSLGLSNSRLEDYVHKPDAYQHLFAPADFDQEVPLVSIYVKMINAQTAATEPHLAAWYLITATREREVIQPMAIWKVYATDLKANLDLATAKPFDLLRSFVDVFGIPFRVLGRPVPDKVIAYAATPMGPTDVNLIDFAPPYKGKFSAHFIFRPTEMRIEIALAYMVDRTKYEANLRGKSA